MDIGTVQVAESATCIVARDLAQLLAKLKEWEPKKTNKPAVPPVADTCLASCGSVVAPR